MQSDGVKVKCRNCGKEAPANQFILDPVYKMMVCPSCVKERRKKAEMAEAEAKTPKIHEEERKPADWDSEDEYLEKSIRRRANTTVSVQKISDDKVRYKCPKCTYEFVYNIAKKIPARCPYCSTDIYSFDF